MNKVNLLTSLITFTLIGCYITDSKAITPPDSENPRAETRIAAPAPDSLNAPDLLCLCPPEMPDRWRVSTNALAWGMAITNAGVEYTFDPRWSAQLSLYYSAWNYFKQTRKFRTFLVRPEVRYWFKPCHRGVFAAAHLELAYYNFALPGWKYRIQDRRGHHPAFGGGVGVGYRVPFRNPRWAFEAQVGAGVYALKYDRFENRHNGPLHDTRKRTWFGIDNVSVGISYNFK